MSGGYFDYNQHTINDIATDIEYVLRPDAPKWILDMNLSFDTRIKFRNAVFHLKMASIYANRIDYLLSGDDGEETFHKRLQEDIDNLLLSEL